MGLKVIYGDTDSIFISTGMDKEKSEKLGVEISGKIDKFYEDYVKKNYSRKSYLDLEFDKLYLALLMPQTRTSANREDDSVSKGAKKRYAGLVELNNKEVLDIVGLEAIRGDWTDAAQEFQKELLMKIFKKEDVVVFIRNKIKEIENGKLNSKLVYRKSIRKDLKDYTKMTPPHVKAARKLDKLNGNVIEYLMTTDGPEPIQKLKHKIDYEHYIEKQIKPIAKTILETMGLDFDGVFEKSSQKKLF
jgi:DNA polymerase-2